MSDHGGPETTLNIPSLVAFALLSFFAIRYFFFSPAAGPSAAYPGSTAARNPAGAPAQIPYDRIHTIAAMFPQLSRRDIEWDLRRNGASTQATTERILRTGRLDAAPAGFRAQEAPAGMEERGPGAGTGAGAAARQDGAAARGQPRFEDLITRYGLADRVQMDRNGSTGVSTGANAHAGGLGGVASEEEAQASAEVKQTAGSALQTSEMQRAKGGWSVDKKERAELLRRRREDMVLQARRKMEEKERQGKPA